MADALFQFKFEDEPGRTFDLTRITRSELSHFKSWYGTDYGERLTLQLKGIRGDGDAVACLMWSCRRENDLPLAGWDPRAMPDFDPDSVFVKATEEELAQRAKDREIPLDLGDNL